jgi:hypothetical protein
MAKVDIVLAYAMNSLFWSMYTRVTAPLSPSHHAFSVPESSGIDALRTSREEGACMALSTMQSYELLNPLLSQERIQDYMKKIKALENRDHDG